MNRNNTDLTERLRSAYEIEMSDATRSSQISAISAALKDAPEHAPAAPSIASAWRRRYAAVLAAATIFTPAAAAVAAEGTIPGDVLYPLKQVTEDVRSVFDPTLAARHRVEEANEMHQMGFPLSEIERIITDADSAIIEAGEPPELRSRLIELMSAMGMDHMEEDMMGAGRKGTPPESSTPDGMSGANSDQMFSTSPGHRDPSIGRIDSGSRYQDMMTDDAGDRRSMTDSAGYEDDMMMGDMSGRDEMTGDTSGENTNHDDGTASNDSQVSDHESSPPTTTWDSGGSWDSGQDDTDSSHDGGGERGSDGSWSP
ncbi:MAG: hypothetical protein M3092_02145 [Actinomycetia bacterium]|nr:hypothetical protein [Actinomycetes bacterium]